MTLPKSFAKDGFLTGDSARLGGRKYRRLMLGTEGQTDTGKTEFGLSAPGPGVCICLDRGFDAALDNPTPPETRRDDFGFVVISARRVFGSLDGVKATMSTYWNEFYNKVKVAMANDDVRTIIIDGDSDSWEIQRLADLGALTGIYPQTKYSPVYAARRAFYAMLWDSGKIIIATNKLKDEWETIVGPDGLPIKENGEDKRRKTGRLERQGFPDQDYLWQIHIRHLYKPSTVNAVTKKTVPQRWGIQIMKCKANKELEGAELWGPECNFQSLVQLVYPQVELEEWGY